MITIYIDGACLPVNPGGFACWAYCAYDENGKCVGQDFGCIGSGDGMTNNVAEHTACNKAFERALREDWRGCQVKSDSQLVVNQVNGSWKCNQPHLFQLLKKSAAALATLEATIVWIPREQNERADHLSNIAYNKARALA